MTDDQDSQTPIADDGQPVEEQPADTPEGESATVAPEEPERHMVTVAYMGALDDCKDVMTVLEEAGVPSTLNVADLVRPDLRSRGYYVVAVEPGLHDKARAAIDAQFREEFNLAQPEAEEPVCPACGTAIAVDAASCPDCGLNFT